jgi:hypothetical protein
MAENSSLSIFPSPSSHHHAVDPRLWAPVGKAMWCWLSTRCENPGDNSGDYRIISAITEDSESDRFSHHQGLVKRNNRYRLPGLSVRATTSFGELSCLLISHEKTAIHAGELRHRFLKAWRGSQHCFSPGFISIRPHCDSERPLKMAFR